VKPKKLVFIFVSVLMLLVVGIGQAEVLPPGGGSGAIFTTKMSTMQAAIMSTWMVGPSKMRPPPRLDWMRAFMSSK
jgi:hypothetical protein